MYACMHACMHACMYVCMYITFLCMRCFPDRYKSHFFRDPKENFYVQNGTVLHNKINKKT